MKRRHCESTLAVALFLLGTSACANLEDFEREVCGNAILESGEDCDGFSAFGENTACAALGESSQCHYVCDPEQGQECPTGWACGQDLRCREGAGSFVEAPSSPWNFVVNDFAVGDVDGDGNADLVGNNSSVITTRLGDGEGGFPSSTESAIRTPEGPVTYDYVDGDNNLDAVVPIDLGVFVLLGNDDGELEPVPYAPFDVGEAEVVAVPLRAGGVVQAIAIIDSAAGVFFIDSEGARLAVPGGVVFSNLIKKVPVGNIDRDAGDNDEFIVAFRGHDKAYVVGADPWGPGGNGLAPVVRQTINLPGPVDRGVGLGDINGDGWLDLYASCQATGRSRVALALNTGTGQLGVGGNADFSAYFDQGLGNDSFWPLAVGDFNGDGVGDFVAENAVAVGVWPIRPVLALPNSTNLWSEAVIGDFNRDGALDFAASSEEEDGIDVFLGSGFGLFNQFYVSTGEAFNLRVGDFDGDFVQDIAYIDRAPSVPDELAVIFGSSASGPSDAQFMGSLGRVKSFTPFLSITSLDTIDFISDILAIATTFPEESSHAVAIFQGSSSRRMISPFTLQTESDDSHVPVGIVVGDFVGEKEGGARDLIAVAQVPQPINFEDGGSSPLGVQLPGSIWLVPGTDGQGGLDSVNAESYLVPDTSQFKVSCARWVVGDIDGDPNTDEAIGLDGTFECGGSAAVFNQEQELLVLKKGQAGGAPFEISEISLTDTVDFSSAQSLKLQDLDNDGSTDLLAVFEGSWRQADDATQIDDSGLAVFWNKEGNFVQSTTSQLELAELGRVQGVQPVQVIGDEVPELLILSESGISYAVFEEETDSRQYDALYELPFEGGLGELGVGDANGDGLADFMVRRGSEVSLYLAQVAPPLGDRDNTEEEGE